MSAIQSFFKAILPRSWAADMEAQSRAWKMRCPCGCEKSVWEAGGIRWKATGNPKRRMKCPACGETTWHTVTKEKV